MFCDVIFDLTEWSVCGMIVVRTYPKGVAMNTTEIRLRLSKEWAALPVYCYDSIDSTNAEGKRMTLPRDVNAALILADTQTAGRGRMDRSFYSPANTGLYMTLVLRVPSVLRSPQGLTPAVAVAAVRAIKALTDAPVAIKWVNDLYANGRKIGGILVEASPDGAMTRLVMGIGINLTTQQFPDGMRAPVGALADVCTSVPSPETLATAITEQLLALIPDGLQNSFDSILPDYRALSLLQPGDPVLVYRGISNTPIEATVLGIADDFSLSVTLRNGLTTSLSDGEVSVRGV